MTYLVDHYPAIIDAFEQLLGALKQLCLHIHDDLVDWPLWIDNGETAFMPHRDKVIHALQHLSPTLALKPQETFSCPGVVAATPDTFAFIKAVNDAKDNFKTIARSYLTTSLADPTKPVRHILASAGYGGIKLKQVYRHIQTINFHPRRVAWTKAHTSSHLIISKHTAREMLRKIGKGEHIEIQLSKLNLLNDTDKLVIYHPIKPCWLANIATFKTITGDSTRLKIRTSLPLFYLHDAKAPLPTVCFSRRSQRLSSTTRINKKIEQTAFLKSISAFRYKTTLSN